MARPPASPRNAPSRRSSSEALAAMLGHQLNNLVVPLDGFADLALQNLAAPELLREDLAEMRMAIGRIKQLALDLESLGESASQPKRATIGACMAAPAADARAASWIAEWLCSAATPVTVDLLHAQRAVQSLARLAEAPGADTPPPRLSVSLALPAEAVCTACGAPFDRKHESVLIETDSARRLDGQALRQPFGEPFGKPFGEPLGQPPGESRGPAPSGGGRSLILAVLVHCAHHAGGHLWLEAAGRRLGLALPGA